MSHDSCMYCCINDPHLHAVLLSIVCAVSSLFTHISGIGWLSLLQVTRPVAAALAPQPVAIHYAASDPFLALMPEGENITRAQPPTGPPACASPNIEFWARLGSVLYGDQPEYNEFVDDDWLPTFLWNATISAIGQTRTRAGVYRQVAVVNLQPHRWVTLLQLGRRCLLISN